MSLNPPQREAVEHFNGPLLVLAGPGSGKTRVITHRIARLIERGVAPERILAVTFTNRAAREMRQRVAQLVHSRAARRLAVSTIHSACVRVLREEIEALGYGRNFTIYDEASQQSLARTVLRDMSGAGATGSASDVLAGASAAKSGRALEHSSVERSAFVAMAVERYHQELRARNAIDFDDIVLLTADLFKRSPEALQRWRERHHFLLVDEYQDTSPEQDEVLELLAGARGNLCVVGDDDQSIYSWRGARVEHVLEFPGRHPGTRVVRLEQNYRSTMRILSIANAAIRKNAKRHDKTLFTERGLGPAVRVVELPDDREEAEFVVQEITSSVEGAADVWKAASRHAILMRTNDQTRQVEQALRQARLPYRILGGRSFFDSKEVLDVVAYLRVASNPSDEEALLRIINVPSRGLGAKSIEAVRAAARELGSTAWRVLRRVAEDGLGETRGLFAPESPGENELPARTRQALAAALPGSGERGIASLVELVDAVAAAADRRSRDLVTDLLEASRYQQEVERTYRDVKVREARWSLALGVQDSWTDYLAGAERPDLHDFLDSLALDGGRRTRDESGGVTVATVHAAKGLEFPVVHVMGLEEGRLPHGKSVDDPASLAEERRLFYVAITRAQDELTLTRAAAREVRGKSRPCVPSRFLEDLPEDAVHDVDTQAPATDSAAESYLARLRALRDA